MAFTSINPISAIDRTEKISAVLNTAPLDSLRVYAIDRSESEQLIAEASGTALSPKPGYELELVEETGPTATVYSVYSHIGWLGENLSIRFEGELSGTPTSISGTYPLNGTPVTDYSPITDVTESGLDNLLSQFKDSELLKAWIASYLDRIQELQDTIYPAIFSRGVAISTGERLDWLGAILNVPRTGRTDDEYRFRLRGEMAVINSGGTLGELLTILGLFQDLDDITGLIEAAEYYPHSLVMRYVDRPLTYYESSSIGNAVERADPAGVRSFLNYSWVLDAATFQFSSTTSSQTDADTGFGAIPTYILNWGYDGTSTELSGLASGDFRINSATFMEATEMYVHDSPDSGGDQSAQLAALLNSHLRIAGASGQFHVLIGNFTDNGGTFTFEIQPSLYVGSLSNGDLTSFYHYTSGGHLAGVTPE